ncbi:cytochrome c-type biogenesis protein CcmH [Granulicella aggregans]|uniref:Cytochrome c-type biogenesis protein n=1 Tax=Granulicella aggregans TaxID=474949 RepID=A0A7W8E538_9BACT|nr:cytochrome c-type biogenesis protein CcmH [Granulicella aggregans]MBB5057815.1 cytochrome c-type biogenesis protein CcmH [Granulicella aggregans]
MSRLIHSRWIQFALVFSLAIMMLGAGDTAEKRFERVGHNMMCACSCGQILLECNHVGCPDSDRMRKELQAQIAGSGSSPTGGSASGGMGYGGSDKQILEWFVAKYGAMVLAAPLRGGFDNVAWITPIALFLLAIIGTTVIIRVWKSRTQQRVPLKIKGMTTSSTDELRERIRRETLY